MLKYTSLTKSTSWMRNRTSVPPTSGPPTEPSCRLSSARAGFQLKPGDRGAAGDVDNIGVNAEGVDGVGQALLVGVELHQRLAHTEQLEHPQQSGQQGRQAEHNQDKGRNQLGKQQPSSAHGQGLGQIALRPEKPLVIPGHDQHNCYDHGGKPDNKHRHGKSAGELGNADCPRRAAEAEESRNRQQQKRHQPEIRPKFVFQQFSQHLNTPLK